MKNKSLVPLFLTGLLLLSGCVAMQEDVTNLDGRLISIQERLAQVETRLEAVDRENRESRKLFEESLLAKQATLSEELIRLRERIATGEGNAAALTEQLKQESERAEKFRTAAGQELLDFQKGLTARLDLIQGELAVLKGGQAKQELRLGELAGAIDRLARDQAELDSQPVQFDTALVMPRPETEARLAVVLEEVSKENTSLRDRLTALEKQVKALKPAASSRTRK